MSCPTAPCAPDATMNSSAIAPCAMNTCCISALIRSDVSAAPSSCRTPSAPGSDSLSIRRATSSAASHARCARRSPAISVSFLLLRRSSKRSRSTRTSTPFVRRWSASSSGKRAGTTASVTPSSRSARVYTSSVASTGGVPPRRSSSIPNCSGGSASMSGAAAFRRSRSNAVMTTKRRPSRSTYRKGSGIPSGTSCRIAGERLVSAWMRTSVMRRILDPVPRVRRARRRSRR